MTIRVAIRHTTHYRFDKPVSISPHVVRLRPAPHSRTPVVSYALHVSPDEHFLNWQQDPFGNYQARLVFPEKAQELSVDVEVIADMTVINPFEFFVEQYAEEFPFEYDASLQDELKPYLKACDKGPLLSQWLQSISREAEPTNDFLVRLNQRLSNEIEYSLRFDPGVQSPEQTLERKIGSCRDTAWLLVQILRHLGLAARFASGYLVQLTSDVKSLDGPSGPEQDFTDLHAWCEVFLPGAGWVGLDPTSGLFAAEGHIPLACTPDPGSAAPISGATEPCEVDFSYSNTVTRIHEDPRVTKPYTEEQWASIDALGRAVDAEFVEGDVRLTMGGEPTFVSIDDMESAQWNTEALGKDKLRLAKDLLLRLRRRFAPQGLLHYGQGKWYPGEEIPRWALGCFWRTDGEPLWRDESLLARVDKDYGFGIEQAEALCAALASGLGLKREFVQPAFEDALYYLWREQGTPPDVDLYSAKAKDELERKRMAGLLRRGLDTPTGVVLPLFRDLQGDGWISGKWELRADRVVLLPGDSPMGLRLPLDSLPAQRDIATELERDPFEPRTELQPEDSAPGKARQVDNLRSTLCVEPREGRLHVFVPPLQCLEHYIGLIDALEAAAASLELPVVIEGYEPPRDPRLQKLLVTPDPGVIEVNIHPASNWDELVENTNTLYEEARQSRLATEKFMLDGRHTGTGGGNHVTLGGVTPADSPLLRRPDLLRSLVTYWQHHPSLSYLFSGMFIGPTSQAPRVDEGRDDMLYELEIAFQQMPPGIVNQPWLVDRLMRNLLVDITGNTHRAEFCIDKLYSPNSASGRQGILEFRGFEMPPHARMSLVQTLLLRCLVARFWKTPYQHEFVRWGTELHDRFMMPHYVWSDIKEVVSDLTDHGYPFELDWLAPFEEFRFPHYGRLELDDIQLELRWAIEPWHVLGEEVGSFGTARYVDSSVERLQIKAQGLTPERHLILCNGRRVPLQSTGRHGEFVAAVRYRAWHPPSALHPTIGVQAPLVFDVYDTWNRKSVGGCTYHVSHAGGRSHERFPINAMEAESRRISRFWQHGHTPGSPGEPTDLHLQRSFVVHKHHSTAVPLAPVEDPSDEYPHTLDLRKQQAIGLKS